MNLETNQLLSICNTHGTPLYIYDGEEIKAQVQKLNTAFASPKFKIKYAMKALSNINILKLLRKEGVGLDVVSVQEAKIGLLAGYQAQEILFTPNCVSLEEIKEAVALGLVINIDNISILEQFGHEFHNTVPCCIRINPHIAAGGNSKIQVGHIDSKFGISIFQLRHILKVVETNNIKVIGLHMHTGSDILNSDVFLQAADVLFEAAHHFPNLDFLDFGSGFKVAYQENDITTDIDELGGKIITAFDEFCKSYGKELEIWFEPGKFLVSSSGYLCVRTNVIKHTPAAAFVGVDSGMNHLLRPMMYNAHHEIVNLSNPKGATRVYDVVGYICETDTFGHNRKLNEVREGDVIAIKNAGAYGFSMASNYNSRLRPAEVLVDNKEAKLIRKRETLEDLIKGQVY